MSEAAGLIYSLIPKVSAAIGAIPKSQLNAGQGFKFRGIDQFLNAAHKAFNEAGIFTTAEVEDLAREERPSKSGGVMLTTLLRVRYTFYAPDGSSVATVTQGEGMDNGDKATAKAMSVSAKYAYAFTFNVPTEDIVDGDADDPGAHVAAPAPKAAPANPAPKPAAKAPAAKVAEPYSNSAAPSFDAADILTWDGTIPSKFDNGWCKLCGKRHIPKGDPIVNLKGVGYAALSCAEAHNAALAAREPEPVEGDEDLPF